MSQPLSLTCWVPAWQYLTWRGRPGWMTSLGFTTQDIVDTITEPLCRTDQDTPRTSGSTSDRTSSSSGTAAPVSFSPCYSGLKNPTNTAPTTDTDQRPSCWVGGLVAGQPVIEDHLAGTYVATPTGQ